MVFHTVLQYTYLKTVIVCALDATYIDALNENSNGCLNRSFGNIKRLPRLLFQCIPWPNRDGNPFGENGEARVSAANVRLIARTKVEFQERKFHAEYLAQTYWLGIEDSRERQLFIYRGG